MRLPVSWDDRSLLKDEPFQDLFQCCKSKNDLFKSQLAKPHCDDKPDIVKTLESDQSFGKAALAWFKLTLKYFKPNLKPTELEQLEVGWNLEKVGILFIKVFWHFHNDNESGATCEIRDNLGVMVQPTSRNPGEPESMNTDGHSQDNYRRRQESCQSSGSTSRSRDSSREPVDLPRSTIPRKRNRRRNGKKKRSSPNPRVFNTLELEPAERRWVSEQPMPEVKLKGRPIEGNQKPPAGSLCFADLSREGDVDGVVPYISEGSLVFQPPMQGDKPMDVEEPPQAIGSDSSKGPASGLDTSDRAWKTCGCLTFEPILEPKPRLPDDLKPPIWAECRQDLCESFPWFRAYQSGVYHSGGVAMGYLLSAFSSFRDTFWHGGRLIVSHGGGKTMITRDNGGTATFASDQRGKDRSVNALLNTYNIGKPIVLLIDDKYRLFPYRLGMYVYAILGYYRIKEWWAEREPANNALGYCVKYKFAFQWCENQGDPWWLTSAESGSGSTACCRLPALESRYLKNPLPFQTPPDPVREANIKRSSPRWDSCDRANNSLVLGCESDPSELLHLQVVTRPGVSNLKYSRYRRCPSCGSTSPRIFHQSWMCLVPSCPQFWSNLGEGDRLQYSRYVLSLRNYRPNEATSVVFVPPPVSSVVNGITTTRDFFKGWWCDGCGRLNSREKWEHWHCGSCGKIYELKGRIREASEFPQLGRNSPIDFHTIHSNSGIDFTCDKWVHGDDEGVLITYTLPADCGKIHLITANPRSRTSANEIFRSYQEQAEKGSFFRRYPLRNHMLRGRLLTNYFSHNSGAPYKYIAQTSQTTPLDQAPKPVIGALQLIKDRIAHTLEITADFNEILSVAYMEEQKMSFHSDSEPGLAPVVASLSMGSEADMHFRLLRKYLPPNTQRQRALTIHLHHGDVLVMDGEGIQTKYEHTVIPKDFRIAATARYINVVPREKKKTEK